MRTKLAKNPNLSKLSKTEQNRLEKLNAILETFRRGKNYLVQYTTGSGKSYSIGWLSHTLISLYQKKGDTKRMFDTIIVVGKFKTIEDEGIKEGFRSKIQSYIRMYGYLSQIITFIDIELEKSFVLLKFLNKKLPKRETGKLDISDTIDLDSLRIQKIHEKNYELATEYTVLDPPDFEGSGVVEPEYDFLSEIINQINNVYGVSLTDEDKIDLSRLKRRLEDNPEIEKYMTGENTDDNKQNYFKEQFDGLIVDYVNERFEFYKKMEDNPSIKTMIFQKIYADYQKSRIANR